MSSVFPWSSLSLAKPTSMPMLGLGTWLSTDTENMVCHAIDLGYRHVDTAWAYGNEKAVGKGIRMGLSKNNLDRSELFVTTKLWNTHHYPEDVEKMCRESLYETEVPPLQTWLAMERLVDLGLARNIGVSNFNSKQIKDILENGKIRPLTNQIEVHPYLQCEKIRDFCSKNDILITAFSPFGSPKRPWAPENEQNILEDPVIMDLAKKHTKTCAQIILRWLLQRGIVAIPKSSSTERIRENCQLFDFELTKTDMDNMAKLDKGEKGRRCLPPNAQGQPRDRSHPHYPVTGRDEDF